MNTSASLARKRAEERLLQERKQFLKSEADATFVAEWESSTDKKIEQNKITKIANDLAQQDSSQLLRRQKNIKELYEKEQLMWKDKIDELKLVSNDDRMRVMQARATELKNKSEKEMEDFCIRMLEKQKIEGSEELRNLNRKSIVQVLTPAAKIESRSIREHTIFSNPTDFAESQKDSDIEKAKKRNMEMKSALDEQVRMNREKKEFENQQKRLEEKMQLDDWNREALLEKSNMLQRKKEMQMKKSEEFKHTMQDIQIKRERDATERRRHEEFSIQSVLHDVGFSEANDKKNYIESLKYQISAKNTANHDIDIIRDAYQEKISSERESELRDRDEARKKTNLEVALEHKTQVLEKMLLRDREKEEMSNYIRWELEQLHSLEMAEQAEAAKKKKATIENAQYNLAEIERKKLLRRLEKEKSVAKSLETEKRWQIV